MKFFQSNYGSPIDSCLKSRLFSIENRFTKAFGTVPVPARRFGHGRQRNSEHMRSFKLQPRPKYSKRHLLRSQFAITLAKVRNQCEEATNSANSTNSSQPELALYRFKFPLVEVVLSENKNTNDTGEPIQIGPEDKSTHKTCMTVSAGFKPGSSQSAALTDQSEPTSGAGSAQVLPACDSYSALKCCTLILLVGLTGGSLSATEIFGCLRFQPLQNYIRSVNMNQLVRKEKLELAKTTKRANSVEYFALLLSSDSLRAALSRNKYDAVAQKDTLVSSTSQTQATIERGAKSLHGDFLTPSIGLWKKRVSQAKNMAGFLKRRALLIVVSAWERHTLIHSIDDEFSLMARSADAVLDFQNRRHLLQVDHSVQRRLYSNYGPSARNRTAKLPIEWWQILDQEENTLGLLSSQKTSRLEIKSKDIFGKQGFYHELEALIPKPWPISKEDIKASAPKLKWNWRFRIVRFHGDHDPRDNFSPSLETAPRTDTRRFRQEDPPILMSKYKHNFRAKPLKPCLRSGASFGLCNPMIAPPPVRRSRRVSGP